jgi:L-aminopeptidase/D-esterase-like protein
MAVFDLLAGDPSVRPGPDAGYAACVAATAGEVPLGRVGVGAGCTMGKWRGRDVSSPGGLGAAVLRHDDVVVAALVAVNSVGDLFVPGEVRVPVVPVPVAADELQATTIGVVVTNGRLSKLDCLLVAQSGHDGLARALDPAHTAGDGDTLVAAATGAVEAPVSAVRALAAHAVDQAVRDAVTRANT